MTSLFSNISTGVPSVFPQRAHPLGAKDDVGKNPVETNKFYGNMLLGGRELTAFPHPYSVWWTNVSDFYGLGVSHVLANQRVFGPKQDSNPAEYYLNPTMIMSMCLSATEFLSKKPDFSTNSWGPLSVVAQLSADNKKVQFPIVNGMGFVTGLYGGLKPIVSSQIGFKAVSSPAKVRDGLTRVQVDLKNNVTWLVYVTSPSKQNVTFNKRDDNHLEVNSNENNLVVQIATIGDKSWIPTIDAAAGAYATSVKLNGGVTSDKKTATYRLEYTLTGSSTGNGTLIYAMPHHVESFTSAMNGKVTKYQLNSTNSGNMTLCVAQALEMYEKLPTDVGFLPWRQGKNQGDNNFSFGNFSPDDIKLLKETAQNETNLDMNNATNKDSMYFSGKALDKYAFILLVAKYIIKDDGLAKQILEKIKKAFDTFLQNKQQTPLFYDTTWKGLCSQAGISDPNNDFGNTYYNDHHFHYSYFVHAAAIVGKVDKDFGGSWAKDNKEWVNTLVRDVANFGDDPAFPTSRSFDWFQGHSLAKGLFLSADGKDEESSSEDYHFYYGMKLWGQVIGDAAMEARGNLIVAIEARAMNKYMLYQSNNKVEPAQILPNKVSGIKFENKIHHTTYFGTNLEYIQGIHMIPLTPISSLVRGPTFVKEEWDSIIGNLVEKVDSGWKGILQMNRALIDPKAAYAFFSQGGFQNKWLDDGLSRTWALAYSKGLI